MGVGNYNDIIRSNILRFPSQDIQGEKAVMLGDDGLLELFDTTQFDNLKRYLGVTQRSVGQGVDVVRAGVFRTTLANGFYYSDEFGNLVNLLPPTSVTHLIGEVRDGWFVLNDSKDSLVINNTFSNIIGEPQVFNPTELVSDVFSLSGSGLIAFVAINGQSLKPSEYNLVGSDLTITPENGFFSLLDEVLVLQQTTSVAIVGFNFEYVSKTANYSMDGSEYTVDCTDNTFTVTTPDAATNTGKVFNIKNSGFGIISVTAFGAQDIDGQTTIILTNGESLNIQSTGVNFIIL